MKKSKLQSAQEKRDTAKAAFEAKLYQRKLSVLNKWDAVDPNNERKRRNAAVETEKEESVLRPYDRLKSINLTRDLHRNFTAAKSILRQIEINAVGPVGGKLRFNSSDPQLNKQVAGWFNGIYAKNCDSRDSLHWSDFLKLSLISTVREGDCLVTFDDFDRNDGKLIFWESDQLVEIEAQDWKAQTEWTEQITDSATGKKITIPMQQASGVVYDSKGRVRAYVVSAKHGVQTVKRSEATILPIDTARLLKRPWRFNQLRGNSELLTASTDLLDLYEMRAKELQSAKLAASIAGKVKRKDGMAEAMARAGVDPEEVLDNTSEPSDTEPERNYENFESLTGGLLEYLDTDEDFEILDFNRPNIALKEFFDFVLNGAGAALGLSRTHTTLQASTAYTAFRGEMLMSWASFQDMQKWLERQLCDWVAVRALQFAQASKELPKLPAGWQGLISWNWPKMPQVDPEKEWNALNNAIKNAYTDYAEVLGPDWEERFDLIAQQLAAARDKKLPLSAFETRAGAPTTSATTQENTNSNEENLR